MSFQKSLLTNEITKRGSIKDSDVLALRGAFYDDGVIDADEAGQLFELNEACPVQDPKWADFFVEAITDHIVHQAAPEGYIVASNAEWLIARIGRDGRVETKTELELLVNVLDKSRWSPASLVRFALDQVKHAVISGTGPLRGGATLQPGTIAEAEVELLRRILYAFGGDGNVGITRTEAEVLFDINDATAASGPNPAWTELFVKAIANVLMASSGYTVPTREEALHRESWLAERGELAPVSMLGDLVTSSLRTIIGSYQEQTAEERALSRLERQRIEIITNEEITEGEATWLAGRIARDGEVTANEAALIAFLSRECPRLHPALNGLIARYGQAA